MLYNTCIQKLSNLSGVCIDQAHVKLSDVS